MIFYLLMLNPGLCLLFLYHCQAQGQREVLRMVIILATIACAVVAI